jgi:two-component system, cell cycle sensor histidine kinase and response regulator CckA
MLNPAFMSIRARLMLLVIIAFIPALVYLLISAPDIDILLKNLLALLAVALFTMAFAWFGADCFVLRRMRKLIRATEELAKGNLKTRIAVSGKADEIDQLAESFNSMAQALELQREEQRQSAGKYRLLFEESKEIIFISTPEGRYLDVNPAGVELSGYTREEMLTLDIKDLYVDPAQRQEYKDLLYKNGFVKNFRLDMKRKDGRQIVMLTTTVAVRNERGDIIAFEGICHDITEREREREALQEQMERLDLALKSANMGVWHVDIANNRCNFDDRSFDLLGINPSTFRGTGQEFFNVVHPDDRENLRNAMIQTIEQDIPYTSDYRVIWPDGTTRFLSGRGKIVRDETGRPVKIHGINWDITDLKLSEMALAESEERLKLTLDAAHIVAWEINVDGSHLESGPVHELFGKPKGFFHPGVEDLFESIHPEDREEMKALVRDALQGKRKYYIEFRVPQKDGGVRWIEAIGTLMKDAHGKPARILGIAHNVTERKLAEQILLESENRTRGILQAMPIGIHMYRLESDERLVFAGANPQADRILGVKHDMFVGKTIEEVFPALADSDIPCRYREVAASGKMWQTEEISYEHGSIKGAFKVYAFQTSPNNMVAAFEDITEPKKMEDALRQSEERFRRLVEHSNDIIVLLDNQGIGISISGPLQRILGYTPDEMKGKSVIELVHPDYIETATKMYTDLALQPGSSVFAEFRMRHKNGSWVAVEAVGSNFLEDPNIKAVVANIRDISERTRLQEQLQQAMKLEAIGRLAGGVAHDFNNLLTVISGNIQMAMMELRPSATVTHYLDQVRQATDRATALTRQLLAFSRRQIIEPKILNLNELILNVRQMISRLIGENIELSITLDEDLSPVKIDPGQFEQVLVNLAINASDAMSLGGKLMIQSSNVTLDANYCAMHPDIKPGNFVLLAVSDTGQGMSEEVKEHIFEPFFTTKETGRGTGLGLAMIFGIVKQAGGAIDVFTEVDRGTTFKIYLPRIEGEIKTLNKPDTAPTPRGSETILLVEDEDNVREVAEAILKELGYNVMVAKNGMEALAVIENSTGNIELLITDIVMPGMNGRELAEHILGTHPEIRVLYTSGYTEDVIVHHGVIEEHINFLGKPYTLQTLGMKIREILDSNPAGS